MIEVVVIRSRGQFIGEGLFKVVGTVEVEHAVVAAEVARVIEQSSVLRGGLLSLGLAPRIRRGEAQTP